MLNFAKAGLVLQNVPQKYRPGTTLPAEISEEGTHIPPSIRNGRLMRNLEWDPFHHLILQDEKARVESGVLTALSSASAIGIPPIIAFGSEDQKKAWLPGIFTGEVSFCLGATEPSGGSDLANLKTTAKKTEDGKHYIVNGYKVICDTRFKIDAPVE